MLSDKEFERLQKLACIKLDEKEKSKLGNQLINIIDFLDKLKNIDLDSDLNLKSDLSIKLLGGTKQYDNINGILDNIKHSIINRNVLIKSVLS